MGLKPFFIWIEDFLDWLRALVCIKDFAIWQLIILKKTVH